MSELKQYYQIVIDYCKTVSMQSLGWLAVVFMHCATIPPLVALMLGVSDHLPTIDVVLFVWAGLVLMFIKSVLTKDTLITITISAGFIVQSVLLGFLIFK